MEHVAYISDPTLDQVLETEQAVYEYIGQKWA
jgi:1-deoxy-D-xylulose-5-phosphate reductoisomerase